MRPRDRITETKIANQKLLNDRKQINSFILISEAMVNVDKAARPGSPLCLQLVRSDLRLNTIGMQIICVIQELL